MNRYAVLLFPLGVLVFILLTSQFIFGTDKWIALTEDKDKIQQEQQQVDKLKSKLAVLSSVDSSAEEGNLKYLQTAMPNTKMVWYVVSQLKLAASESAAVVESYKGSVGTGLTEASGSAVKLIGDNVDLKVTGVVSFEDQTKLSTFFSSLYRRLPLVSVRKASYSTGKLTVDLVSAWSPYPKIDPNGGELPDYKASFVKAQSVLNGYIGFAEMEAPDITPGAAVVNPF